MSDEKKQQQSFSIGQVVYVLSDKAEAIVPAIVVEEMVVKKLDGSSVSWKVAVGPPEKKKIVASHELSGDVYTSLDEIKEVMTKRLSKFVNELIYNASKRTEAWYGKQVSKGNGSLTETSPEKIDPASLIDSIEGRENANLFLKSPGQEVTSEQQQSESYKVTAPTNQGPLKREEWVDPNDPKAVLRARLKQMAEPEGEEVSEDYTGEFIETPDGRRIPVKYNHSE